MSEHPRIDVTVDVVALAEMGGTLHALVVRRGNPPFRGRWALPGGYLEHDEDLAPAAVRELHEETGLELAPEEVRQLGAYGEPDRDPRNRTVSVTFLAELDEAAEVVGGSDADDAQWRPVDGLLAGGEAGDEPDGDLAFDHALILGDAVAASRWASVPSAHADPG